MPFLFFKKRFVTIMCFSSVTCAIHSALTAFRKETESGDEMELHNFEVAALMNLVATDTSVDEAKALIPSLARFPELAVDEILELIRATMIRIIS